MKQTMEGDKIKTNESDEQKRIYVKIGSQIHHSMHHLAEIDLRCYEKMPMEKQMEKKG